MSVTFLHTADWQLGKPFAGVADPQKRGRLEQERIEVLHRIAAALPAHDAQFVVAAGDLFDSANATRSTVSAACAAIGAMGVPVYAIPGNHDHAGPGSVWEQRFFVREREQLAPNLHVLLQPEPIEIEAAILYPCPLLRRRESADATGWLRTIKGDSDKPHSDKPRIVIAHGSVQEFGARDDEESAVVNRIDLTRLPADAFDYIALGDWHGAMPVSERAWYSGTPEPDRFPKGDAYETGCVLRVTARRGSLPKVTAVRTARFGWHAMAFEFDDDTSVPQLAAKVDALLSGRAGQDLLLLELGGTLGIDATTQLEQMIEAWQARLLRLKLRNDTVLAPSAAEIEALTHRVADPLIARVAAKLVERAAGDNDGAAVARVALRELHTACCSG